MDIYSAILSTSLILVHFDHHVLVISDHVLKILGVFSTMSICTSVNIAYVLMGYNITEIL
jgi:hypothetical protein